MLRWSFVQVPFANILLAGRPAVAVAMMCGSQVAYGIGTMHASGSRRGM